jgi:hypothetical protein
VVKIRLFITGLNEININEKQPKCDTTQAKQLLQMGREYKAM